MYLFALIFSVAIFGAVAAFYSTRPCFNLFHPLSLYLAFHGVVFVFRPLLAYYFDYSIIYQIMQFIPSESDKLMTLVVTNLGLLAFSAGSLWAGNEPFRFNRSEFETRRRQALLKPLLITLTVLAPLAAYSLYIVWVDRSAGSLTYELDYSTGTTINSSGNGYLKQAQIMLVPITLLFAWINRFRLVSLIPFALFVFFRAGTGGRGPIIVAMFVLACFFLYEKRKSWLEWRVLVAGFAAILLFNFIGTDRGARIRDALSDQATVAGYEGQEVKLAPLEGMDLGNLEFTEFLVHTVPNKTGTHEFFVNQLQIFTEPIPRALWKDKPIGQPIRLFNLFDYGNPIGMTRSLPGEGWTQMGLAGVVFWCGFWGAMLGAFYNWFMRSSQSVMRIAVYFCVIPLLIIFYRDGYPLTLFRLGIFVVGPIIMWKIVSMVFGSPEGRNPRHIRFAHGSRVNRSDAAPTIAQDVRGSFRAHRRQDGDDNRLPRAHRHGIAQTNSGEA